MSNIASREQYYTIGDSRLARPPVVARSSGPATRRAAGVIVYVCGLVALLSGYVALLERIAHINVL